MNKTTVSATLALSLVLASTSLRAQEAAPEVTVAEASANALVASLIGLSAEERKVAIEAAIAANPSTADEVVAALIARFPREASAVTETVVQALIGLPTIDTAVKSEILRDVAIQAVRAAEFIPSGSVDNLVTTINSVKNALAQVGPVYAAIVAPFTVPVATIPSNNPNGVLIDQNQQGQTIVSDDTVAL
jgi:hypothetical protein